MIKVWKEIKTVSHVTENSVSFTDGLSLAKSNFKHKVNVGQVYEIEFKDTDNINPHVVFPLGIFVSAKYLKG
jgi:hypothetical protein